MSKKFPTKFFIFKCPSKKSYGRLLKIENYPKKFFGKTDRTQNACEYKHEISKKLHIHDVSICNF